MDLINKINKDSHLTPKQKEAKVTEILNNRISYSFLIYCLNMNEVDLERLI
jgi:hypothetical protein